MPKGATGRCRKFTPAGTSRCTADRSAAGAGGRRGRWPRDVASQHCSASSCRCSARCVRRRRRPALRAQPARPGARRRRLLSRQHRSAGRSCTATSASPACRTAPRSTPTSASRTTSPTSMTARPTSSPASVRVPSAPGNLDVQLGRQIVAESPVGMWDADSGQIRVGLGKTPVSLTVFGGQPQLLGADLQLAEPVAGRADLRRQRARGLVLRTAPWRSAICSRTGRAGS